MSNIFSIAAILFGKIPHGKHDIKRNFHDHRPLTGQPFEYWFLDERFNNIYQAVKAAFTDPVQSLKYE